MTARFTLLPFLILFAAAIVFAQTPETKPAILVIDSAKTAASDFTNQNLKFLVTGAETENRMTVFESTEHPGFKTQWHSHPNCEETFYILEGTLTVKSGGKTYHAPAGSFVYIPRDTPHGQGNFTNKPVRFITTFTPGGAEVFFRDRERLMKDLKPSDPAYAGRLEEARQKNKFWVNPLGTWEPDTKP
jgi:quercetin dioxygenase-like cupin family protein